MPRHYKHLAEEERDRLSLFRAQGKSLREIAGLIGRDVSTVSRELKRNTAPVNVGYYLPHKAQERADARKAIAHERQRLRDPKLRRYVRIMLQRGWSPERIAGRWKKLGLGFISYEAIYQWIYADSRDLAPHLHRYHRIRFKHRRRGRHRTTHIPSRTPIAQRPEAVALRKEPGHWEGDTIIGRHSQSALQVLVERKTRYTCLSKLQGKNAKAVKKTITHRLKSFPIHLRRSITYDNGSENAKHLLINKSIGTQSYFCDPMCSWQKGSVENVNRLVRRRLPKGTDFTIVSLAKLKKTERWLNNLPRKCLGFQTPAEAFRDVALNG